MKLTSYIVAVVATGMLLGSASASAATCNGVPASIAKGNSNDAIKGTPNDDVIAAGGGADSVFGLGGDDIICGGDGDDLIRSGGGDDEIFGDNGLDEVRAGSGDDEVNVGACTGPVGTCGNLVELATTGSGDDSVLGNTNTTLLLSTGDGQDSLGMPFVTETFIGFNPSLNAGALFGNLGAGADIANFSGAAFSALEGGPGDDIVTDLLPTGGSLIELYGQAGSDYLRGPNNESMESRLFGGLGDDVLKGGTICGGGEQSGIAQPGDQFFSCGSTF